MKKLAIIFGFILIISSFSISAQESFKINKGWNIVPLYYLDEIEGILGPTSLEGTVFYLDPITKKYNLFDNHGLNEGFNDIANNHYLDDSSYIINNPLWFFSNDEFIINRDFSDLLDSEIGDGDYEFKLFEGWNIVRFNKFFVGNNFDDITADCQLEKIHEFDSGSQTWSSNKLGKLQGGSFRDVDDDKYNQNYAIKVNDNCNFDFKTESTIPKIPALPE